MKALQTAYEYRNLTLTSLSLTSLIACMPRQAGKAHALAVLPDQVGFACGAVHGGSRHANSMVGSNRNVKALHSTP